MTLTSLQSLSDAEFLAHPDVRRAYWKAMGKEGPWKHSWGYRTRECDDANRLFCSKCGMPGDNTELRISAHMDGYHCHVPDPIPGSLADATEALREKVAESDAIRARSFGGIDNSLADMNGATGVDCLHWGFVLATPRQRFLVFLAALGAVDLDTQGQIEKGEQQCR